MCAKKKKAGRQVGSQLNLSSTQLLTSALSRPNGGGKSVVLKTAALYALLVRLGVPLPGDPPRFLFDIGIRSR